MVKGDKSINEPIFIISLMMVLKLLDRKGKVEATGVLVSGPRGERSEGECGEVARKVCEIRPLLSRQRQTRKRRCFCKFQSTFVAIFLIRLGPLFSCM